MHTNVFCVINGISTFLPLLRKKPQPTAVVITGSMQGMTKSPENSAYNASKAAIATLAEHLRHEMSFWSTSVHLLVPGRTLVGITEQKNLRSACKLAADCLQRQVEECAFHILGPDTVVAVNNDRKRKVPTADDAAEDRPPPKRCKFEPKDNTREGVAKQEF